MPAFPSRPLNKSPLYLRLKRHPALFGVPFLLVMVGASFGLQSFTQTRYDLHSQKVTQVRPTPSFLSFSLPCRAACSVIPLIFQMSREQELGLDRNRKKFDAREEYFVSLFRLPSATDYSEIFVSVEAECGESRGMGTEAHRETERFAGMGRRACRAAKPTTCRPSAAKDLTCLTA